MDKKKLWLTDLRRLILLGRMEIKAVMINIRFSAPKIN